MFDKYSNSAMVNKSNLICPRNTMDRNEIDIDTVVRNSLNCVVKNNLVRNSLNNVVKNNIERLARNKRDCLAELNSIRNDLKNKKAIQEKKKIEAMKMKSNMIKTENLTIKKENIDTKTDVKQLDDSLTNLQWLTGVKINDILEGKPVTYAPLSPAPSNASDDNDDKRYIKREKRFYSDSNVDYRLNDNIKPPYSYASLIVMAMKSKSCAKMTLAEIYKWITDNFQFYKQAEQSWQNSIRHNLSLNKCFAKIPRKKGDPGKGGYWQVVPEYASKLLETSIRKRRTTSVFEYNCRDVIKRQRLDLIENRILCGIKPENTTYLETDINNNNMTPTEQSYFDTSDTNETEAAVNSLADLDHCRMDHPYGKNPFSKYEVTDEEQIKALAYNLQRTSNSLQDTLGESQDLQTIASVMRSDCIWSSNQLLPDSLSDNLAESMSKVTEELLQARNQSADDEIQLLVNRNLGNSLNNSDNYMSSPFCLSPPLSGDENRFSDDRDDENEPPVFSDNVNLTVKGTSMKLYEPSSNIMHLKQYIKEEPLSPEFRYAEE